MLQPYSLLRVADNTGAMLLRVIQPARGKRSFLGLGDVFTATVRKARPITQIKKGEVVKAVVIRERRPYQRTDGTTIAFGDNACVILNAEGNVIGTRVAGPVAREVRERGFLKIAQLAKEVV